MEAGRGLGVEGRERVMPTAALRPCSYPGCPNLVRRGRCDVHPAPVAVVTRPPERQRLYDRGWRARRQAWLAGHPWCEECLRANLYTPATDVHHVQRHQGDALVFRTSPLQSLCHICHTKVTNQEMATGRGL